MATENQKAIAKRVAEKVRKGIKVSVSQEIRESKVYSPSMASHPNKITKSKAWPELMQEYLPDKELAKVHKSVLNKKEVVIVGDGKGESHWEYTGQPHTDALRAVDIAYKVGKKYDTEINANNVNIVVFPSELIRKRGIRTSETDPSAERDSELPIKVQGS